jgi:hypothetical protein
MAHLYVKYGKLVLHEILQTTQNSPQKHIFSGETVPLRKGGDCFIRQEGRGLPYNYFAKVIFYFFFM